MKTLFYTDNAKPCWSCSGTVAEYETDSEVTLIEVRCRGCGRRDVFRPVDPTAALESAAQVSAAHRKVP